MPRFGVHNSIAGGLTTALDLAVRLGCDCMQMFVRNQRQWRAPPLTDEQVAAWRARRAEAAVAPIVVHGSYLVNLAAADPALRNRSYAAFLDEFDRCQRLGIDYLVIHPGSAGGAGAAAEADGIGRVIESLNRLATDRPVISYSLPPPPGEGRGEGISIGSAQSSGSAPPLPLSPWERGRGEGASEGRGRPGQASGSTMVLLETTAGQGASLGWRFEQLAEMLRGVARAVGRVGVCLDTCHVFAAGYDLRTPEAVRRTLDEFDATIGLDRLAAIHVNDSLRELGSRVDRHAHIGQGQIGDRGFWSLLRDPRLAAMPMILETPKAVDPKTGRDWDALNLARLRALARRKTPPPGISPLPSPGR